MLRLHISKQLQCADPNLSEHAPSDVCHDFATFPTCKQGPSVLSTNVDMRHAKLNAMTQYVKLPAAKHSYAIVQLLMVAVVDTYLLELWKH